MNFVARYIVVIGLLTQTGARFPNIEIKSLCSDDSVFGSDEKAMNVCRRLESEARDRLRSLWPGLKASEKAACLREGQLGIDLSYVEIVGCIDMSRELRREESLQPKTSVPPSSIQ